jgi:hypothetical protein
MARDCKLVESSWAGMSIGTGALGRGEIEMGRRSAGWNEQPKVALDLSRHACANLLSDVGVNGEA